MKARDAKRKSALRQLSIANEMRFSSVGSYAGTAGWFTNPGHGGLDAALTPNYIPVISDDPKNTNGYIYMYWRKDYSGYACLPGGQPLLYGFYAKLENPSAADLATISDPFDICVKNTWGMNYKVGN